MHGIKRRTSLFKTDRIDQLYQDPHEQAAPVGQLDEGLGVGFARHGPQARATAAGEDEGDQQAWALRSGVRIVVDRVPRLPHARVTPDCPQRRAPAQTSTKGTRLRTASDSSWTAVRR